MYIPKNIENNEKYLYIHHKQEILSFFSLLSFIGIVWSSFYFFSSNTVLYLFFPFLIFTTAYYIISFYVQGLGGGFNIGNHNRIVREWKPKYYPTVDIFLPICGEDMAIIENTWEGVSAVREAYPGSVKVYCLDDGADNNAQDLAYRFQFNYLVRDNRGHFKKSGNLHHGYKNSFHEIIAIFDADFRPRADFLNELVPYFDKYPHLGIIQTPQYFDVHKTQNWIERGAGAVQEYFYRAVQSARQIKGGAICVGSNALYKRQALESNGGTTLIEHSEDVHTGFDLKRNGWDLLYVPIILAKGVCPAELKGFFGQQYRWCKGSMSLLASRKFWSSPLSTDSRICYISGFLYYISTAVMTIVSPLIPLALLFIVPEQAKFANYIFFIPSLVYMFIVLPLWHRSSYRSETISIKIICGWAHLFAVVDSIFGSNMPWHPTGNPMKKSSRYVSFLILITVYSFLISCIWVVMAMWYMIHWSFFDFVLVFMSGVLYMFSVGRIIKSGLF